MTNGDEYWERFAERVAHAEEEDRIARCLAAELWKFNGGVKPKFWFGDQVKHHQDGVGVILGIEWREKDYAITFEFDGWFYSVGYPGLDRLIKHSEIALKAIAQTEGEKCPGF